MLDFLRVYYTSLGNTSFSKTKQSKTDNKDPHQCLMDLV